MLENPTSQSIPSPPSSKPWYLTTPVYRKAVDDLIQAISKYQQYFRTLPHEKQCAEIYFWQEFVSSLD